MGSRRLNYDDQEGMLREKQKHQDLLQDFLVLQKECVLKKRKLKEANERKKTLLDEIRFLRHRRNFLLKMQSQTSVRHNETIESQKMDAQHDAESSRRYTGASSSGGEAFSNHKPPLNPLRNSGRVVKDGAAFPPLNLGKKPKNLLTNGKRAEKRKISWQDPLALKV